MQLLCTAKRKEAIENLLDWNGKTDTLRAAQDGGIDSKDLSRLIDQGSAAVAGIDGRIGLQRAMFVEFPISREDAGGHGKFETRRIPNGEQSIPLIDCFGTRALKVRTRSCCKLEQRQIGSIRIFRLRHRILCA